MLLFVGLGNPGTRYARNRHNIGFLAVDEIARRHGFGPWRRRFQGEAAEGTLGSARVILLKPTTYMNESGRAVQEALNFFKEEGPMVSALCEAVADNAALLAAGQDASFQNKVHLAMQSKGFFEKGEEARD